VSVSRYTVYKNAYQPKQARGGVERLDVALVTYAKRERNHPYLVLNELLACRLGEAMQLPLAQGVPVTAPVFENGVEAGEDTYWGSLSVREDPPPAECDQLVAMQPKLAMGIVVFDAWILNTDRYETNLMFDLQSDEVVLFDHGAALCNSIGPDNLVKNRGTLGFDNVHAVAFELTDWDYLDLWLSKLFSIDSSFITTVVRSVAEPFLSTADAICLAFEIDRRRRTLPTLFNKFSKDRSIFGSIKQLLPAVDNTDANPDYQI
jgi:hypothetical protein